MPLKLLSLCMVCLFLLIGCHDEYTMDYLVEHPSVLEKAIDRCESTQAQPGAISAYCKTVEAAKGKVIYYLSMERGDPIGFGRRIQEAEAAYVKAKQAYQANPSVALQKELEEKQHDMAVLLAIIGINSPE